MSSNTQTYLNEVRAREQAAAEGPWGLYRDPANPDVPKLAAMLERALTSLNGIHAVATNTHAFFHAKPEFYYASSFEALSDIEQIARGELK